MQRTSPWMHRLIVAGFAALGFCSGAAAQLTSPWPSTPGGSAPIPTAPADPMMRPSGAAPITNTPGAPVAASRPNSWPGGAATQPSADAVLMNRYPEVYGQQGVAAPPGNPPSTSYTPLQAARPQPAMPNPTVPGAGVFPSAFGQPSPPVVGLGTKDCQRIELVAVVGPEAVLVNDLIAELESRLERTDKDFEAQFQSQFKEQLAQSRAQGIDLIDQVRQQRRQKFTEDLLAAVVLAAQTRGDRSQIGPNEKQQLDMLADLIKQTVEAKLIFYDARHGIPSEGFANAEKQVNKLFDSTESKRLMKKAKVDSWRDLDAWLRSRGSSVERERRAFLERTIAQQWLQQQIKTDEEITYEQMSAYYRERGTEFDKLARTHWQMISVRFATYPSKSDAFQAISEMGNRILGGADFSDYAEPARNKETGEMDPIREWTPPQSGARASLMEKGMPAPVEKAMLGLPAGQLSPILDDWSGYYIVKVIERLPAGRTPFAAAQEEIRQKIKRKRFQDQVEQYLKKIRDQVPVWTILEDPRTATARANPLRGLYGPVSNGTLLR